MKRNLATVLKCLEHPLSVPDLVRVSVALRKAKGFRTTTRTVLGKLCLVHSEVSEAAECVRDSQWDMTRAPSGKPEGFVVELADAVIRLADIAGSLALDLDAALREKLRYNATRPYRHGKTNRGGV